MSLLRKEQNESDTVSGTGGTERRRPESSTHSAPNPLCFTKRLLPQKRNRQLSCLQPIVNAANQLLMSQRATARPHAHMSGMDLSRGERHLHNQSITAVTTVQAFLLTVHLITAQPINFRLEFVYEDTLRGSHVLAVPDAFASLNLNLLPICSFFC